MNINILLEFNWNTILSIILFFVALGVLVTIHELGHFLVAKAFNVYCSDFSIGFGPKILKIKRKKGETTFSIGIVPLGGYVSICGDENEEENPEIDVPKERTLTGIKRYKRVLIMSAGIVMNFVLAYIIFIISAACFPQTIVNSWYKVNENQTAIVVDEGNPSFNDNDEFLTKAFKYENGAFSLPSEGDNSSNAAFVHLLSKDAVSIEGKEDKKYVATMNYQLSGVNETDISKNIILYEADENSVIEGYTMIKMENDKPIKYVFKEGDKFSFKVFYANALTNDPITNPNEGESFDFEREEDENGNQVVKKFAATLNLESGADALKPIGVSFYKYSYWYGWDSFRVAGKYWVDSTTIIAKALGNLFIGQGWDQIGGPLAIFTQTTDILENNPFYFYLRTWGMISVNLALFNLLPFPGLDGWQIVVEIVEGSVNGIKKAKFKRKHKDSLASEQEKSNVTQDLSKHEVVATANEVNLSIGTNENATYKEWQIPAKVKGIMSYIGLGILFLFMIVVFVKDIFGLF